MQVASPQLDDRAQIDATARQAADILNRGGVIVLPTETVYGVASSVAHPGALERLRRIKDRPTGQPFTVHLPSRDDARKYLGEPPPALERLLRKVMPGPVTIVARVEPPVIEQCVAQLALGDQARDELYHDQTIGLRCPDHALGQAILGYVDAPVVASSANARGQSPPHDAHSAAQAIGKQVDLVVDGGATRHAKASSILRVHMEGDRLDLTVERDGVFDERYVRKLLRWNMLLVCTGNTCRSPMAEAIARRVLAEYKNIPEDQLDAAGYGVRSAGAFAQPGMPASPEAVEALAKLGLDLSQHRSRPLTPELINEADVIYTMTQSHRSAVLSIAPSADEKTFTLDPNGDVADPIGSSLTVYQRCAELIRRRLEQRIREQQP